MDSLAHMKPIEEIVNELQLACNVKRYPMFLSIAKPSKNGSIKYYNQCLNAALETPEHITRISKLLLAANEADIKVPAYIQKAMDDLTEYVERYKISLKNVKLIASDFRADKFTDYMMVAEGLSTAVVPKHLYGNQIEGRDIDDLDDLDDFT